MTDITLRPDSAGDDTNWTPNTGANYAAVDEAVNDGDTTYVARDGTEVDDLYNIETSADLTDKIIDGITIYASAKYVESGSGVLSVSPTLKIGLKTNSTEYWDTGDTITSSYADYSQAWAVNPNDSAAWEKADIDALQIGVRSARTTGTGSKKRVPYVTQVWVVVTYHAAGTTYYETPSGAVTSAGVAVLRTGKITSGALTSAGGLVNSARKIVSGALTSTGVLVNKTAKALAGALTSSSVLTAIKTALVNLAGELTSSGALVNSGRKILDGAVMSAGALVNKAGKVLVGGLTSAGALTNRTSKALSGALTSSGIVAAIKTALISLGGALTPAGGLILSGRKILVGALTSAGALINKAGKAIVGSVAPSGVLSNSIGKILSGVLTSAGTVTKKISHALSGALSFIGTLIATLTSGSVNVPGTGTGSDTGNHYGAGGDLLSIGAVGSDAETYGATVSDTGGHVGAGRDEGL